MDEIIKLTQTNELLGSCPECGMHIWTKDKVHPETEHLKEVYRCIYCRRFVTKDQIIPF